MSETAQYTDLLTVDELKVDALNALNIDVTDSSTVSGMGGSYKDAAILAIRDVTDQIQRYLDRKLIVRKWDIDIPSYKWAYNASLEKDQYYPPQYPIVQVDTSGVTISNDSVRLLAATEKKEVVYYAGYKRRDQTVGGGSNDIDTAANGLDGLTGTPDDLPHNIRRVAFRLVMYELTMALQNTYATASTTKTTGQMTSEITKARTDVYEQELSKLHSHRRII